MSQAIDNLTGIFDSPSLFAQSSPQICCSPSSRTITPTQSEFNAGRLGPLDEEGSRAYEDEIEFRTHDVSAGTSKLLHLGGLPRVDVEAGWEREQQKRKELEANQDKFSTLFEPSTPRASPTLMPELLPRLNHASNSSSLFDQRHATRDRGRSSRPASISGFAGSDFGSLVEVGASEDPLSLAFGDGSNTTADPNLYTTDDICGSSNGTQTHATNSNATLVFFDTFTQHAKQRSTAARSQVLDELLLHEDDPMWFTLENRQEPATDEPPGDEREKPLISLLQEVDHDYFSSSSNLSPSRSRSTSPSHHRRRSRSDSISPLPPAIAPPIIYQLTARPAIGGDQQESDDTAGIDHPKQSPKAPSIEASPSDSAERPISSLSSKLMSSLLRVGQDLPPTLVHASRSADWHLGVSSGHDKPSSTFTSSSSSSAHLRSATAPLPSNGRPFPKALHLHHTETSAPISTTTTTTTTKHLPKRTHLSSSVTHTTSPFASMFYAPPSGAPGFKGDRYDWDKGFSDDLLIENAHLQQPPGSSAPSVKVGSGGPGVENKSEDARSRSNGNAASAVPNARGWSSGFGFGFGTPRERPPPGGHAGPDSAELGDDKDPQRRRHHHHDDSTLPSSRSSAVEFGSLGRMSDAIESKLGNLELVGRRGSSTPVLTPELASKLRVHLPALSRLARSWTLIYSLDQHGISLNTLYSRCESHSTRKPGPGELGVSGGGMMLAVKDAGHPPTNDGEPEEEEEEEEEEEGDERRGALFGAWIAEGLSVNKGKGYLGGGESFLWKYADGQLKVFKTTGRNNYVALCEPEYISFGGGDGHYGLYLDESLFNGSSAACPTFDNEPLCTGTAVGSLKTVNFECVGLEVWGMG